MAPSPKHPLDSLFRTKLRDISWAQFQAQEKALADLPKPWRWPDPKTGIEWSLMGRKAHLLWHASPNHHVKNHTTTAYTVQQAIRNGEAWHESVPGAPDILMLWLGSMREGISSPKIQQPIARALADRQAGLGKPGDGGFLDQMIRLVEQEIFNEPDAQRRHVIHESTSRKWLHGVILRNIQPGSGDWRPICTEALPLLWPIETIERVFAIARHGQPADQNVFFMASDGVALAQQLRGNPVSQRMLDMLCEEVLLDPRRSQHGALVALEQYRERDAIIDERVLEQLGAFVDEDWMKQFPRLRADAVAWNMQDQVPQTLIQRTTRKRL